MIDNFTICMGLAALWSLAGMLFAMWRGYEPASSYKTMIRRWTPHVVHSSFLNKGKEA